MFTYVWFEKRITHKTINEQRFNFQGDLSSLPLHAGIAKVLERAKSIRAAGATSAAGLAQPPVMSPSGDDTDHEQQQQHLKPALSRKASAEASSSSSTCSVCQIALAKDQQSQFCLHCQKVNSFFCWS